MGMEQALISGITLQKNEAQIMVSNVPDRPGIAADIKMVAQKYRSRYDCAKYRFKWYC